MQKYREMMATTERRFMKVKLIDLSNGFEMETREREELRIIAKQLND